MGLALDQIVLAARRTRSYGEKLADGIPANSFAAKPRFGSTIIDCNHPAFVYGHLAIYPARLGGFLGFDTSTLAAPATYTDLFKAGTPCHDDPAASTYPARDEILATYIRTHDNLLNMLPGVSDDILHAPHPDPLVREKFFPTLGSAATFLLCAHPMMHLGQLSTWRRCMGLPGIM